MNTSQKMLIISIVLIFVTGCMKNVQIKKKPKEYAFPEIEAEWIRDGESLEFEGEEWRPTDSIEILLDKEVFLLGEYREIEFFIDKEDVRPYRRLYTKFGDKKFRILKKKTSHD